MNKKYIHKYEQRRNYQYLTRRSDSKDKTKNTSDIMTKRMTRYFSTLSSVRKQRKEYAT